MVFANNCKAWGLNSVYKGYGWLELVGMKRILLNLYQKRTMAAEYAVGKGRTLAA